LKYRVPQITDEMKLKAAHALANLVENPDEDHVIPSPFQEGVAEVVAESVR